ncbi:MAG: PIN domain-containing protein [Acidimicrobiales bacterium]
MSQGLADTSIFIATESGRPIASHQIPDQLAVSVITIGELRAGVLGARSTSIRDQRLTTLTEALQFDPIPIDENVAAAWARLRVLLRDEQLKMPINDSWIAATAMSLDVPVITQDKDFPDLPGLDIVLV